MLPLLLAQLVAPPLQNSPVRLPGPGAVQQRPEPTSKPAPLELQDEKPATTPPASPPAPGPTPQLPPFSSLPEIRGLNRYSNSELQTILRSCSAITDPAERLRSCAAALTARLVGDGYVNSRVYAEASPAPGHLEVIEGRIVELRVNSNDPRLAGRVQRLLRTLQGQVLFLPRVQQQLELLKRLPGVTEVKGNLTRLGSDPTQAVFTVSVQPSRQPWQGEVSLRNDGSNGSGEFRSTGVLVKNALATAGDTLLLYGELNADDSPSLGSVITSLSYTVPISDQLSFTGSFGYSRRNLIELPAPADGIASNQFQGFGQFDYVFRESLSQRWSVSAAFSGNRSNTFLDGQALPDSLPASVRVPQSGYLRLGLSGSGSSGALGWGGTAYLLQGVGAATPNQQRQELAEVGIVPGQATALGALLSGSWGFAPRWQLNLRAGGQVAFNPLTSSMQFSLGSDVGIRGLPGQLISGDNGWLGTGELVWTFWQNKANALQLVPFLGAGGISTNLDPGSFSDTVGSGGLLARWLGGDNWAVELGWAEQFNTNDNPGSWEDWLLGSGLYAQVKYRF